MNWSSYSMDVMTAFLIGICEEVVFVSQPDGLVDQTNPTTYYKLKKAMSGLKQASTCCGYSHMVEKSKLDEDKRRESCSFDEITKLTDYGFWFNKIQCTVITTALLPSKLQTIVQPFQIQAYRHNVSLHQGHVKNGVIEHFTLFQYGISIGESSLNALGRGKELEFISTKHPGECGVLRRIL
ncbi:retrovirus-related pol polyprotein from transposon TNT 1-94 [Tanacetum coccineum]